MSKIPTPTPANIEAVLASIRDGSNVFGHWLKLDRADAETGADLSETCASEALGRTLWWASPIDPSNTVDENAFACGHTPAEAAAAAWVHHRVGGLFHWPTNLSEDEYLSFPRHVPEGWAFDLFDVPDKARKTRQQFASFARIGRVAGRARAAPGRSPGIVPQWPIPTPTPVDVEAVLAGMRDGTSDFARWLELVQEEYTCDELRRISRRLYWADATNTNCVSGCQTGGGATPVEAAAAAWVIACLGEGDGIGRYPSSITEQEYLTVPRRVAEGWCFEIFDWPAEDPRSSKYIPVRRAPTFKPEEK